MSQQEVKEQLDERQTRSVENQNLQRGHSAQEATKELGEDNVDYIKEIMENDVRLVQDCGFDNFLADDFVLANYDEREIEAMRWQMWIVWEKIMAVFPDEGDYITGAKKMENYYDIDPSTVPTEPLSGSEKAALHGLRKISHARISRSKDGWQQDMFGKTVAESRVRRDDGEDEKGGLRGLFS